MAGRAEWRDLLRCLDSLRSLDMTHSCLPDEKELKTGLREMCLRDKHRLWNELLKMCHFERRA